MKTATLLFLDESTNNDIAPPAASLTGLLVPASDYSSLRADVYAAIEGEIRPAANTVNLDPPELHFKRFLDHRPDADKFVVLEKLVATAVNHRLRIVRLGYHLDPRTVSVFRLDPNLIGLCWLGLTQVLDPLLKSEVILPVLDAGFVQSFQPVVRMVSQQARNRDLMRASGLPVNMPEHSYDLGEMFYADSKYSALIQLTDVVAGLRRVLETERLLGPHASQFKQRLAAIAQGLDPLVYHDALIQMAEGP